MGDAWGGAWGLAWGDAWGAVQIKRQTPAGRPKKRRHVVEIDGEDLLVTSAEEAEAILARIREEAKEKADLALQRASAAKKRPARKVIADARKALQVPEIEVSDSLPNVGVYSELLVSEIEALYQSTLNTIEIGIWLRKRQQAEEDEEDILLLLL